MSQESGTQILQRARIKAQDNDANGNYAVSDATGLILLNEVLLTFANNVKLKPSNLDAGTTGLTFSAGSMSVVTDGGNDIEEFESFHPSNSATLSYPLAPALKRVSLQDILEMFGYDGDNALAQTASEWTHVAAERQTEDGTPTGLEKWRIWAYPVINRTRYMTVRALVPTGIATLADYPNIATVDSRVISQLLAYEIARLKKETTKEFLDSLLSTIPRDVLPESYGGGLRKAQLQSHVVEGWS